jgi:hypothetical protein
MLYCNFSTLNSVCLASIACTFLLLLHFRGALSGPHSVTGTVVNGQQVTAVVIVFISRATCCPAPPYHDSHHFFTKSHVTLPVVLVRKLVRSARSSSDLRSPLPRALRSTQHTLHALLDCQQQLTCMFLRFNSVACASKHVDMHVLTKSAASRCPRAGLEASTGALNSSASAASQATLRCSRSCYISLRTNGVLQQEGSHAGGAEVA